MYEYEIYNVYFQILGTIMVGTIEVCSDVAAWVIALYDPEMSLESIHEASFRLSYILYIAFFACDAVYEIVTLAADIVFGHVLSPGVGTFYASRCVELCAVSAVLPFALVEWSAGISHRLVVLCSFWMVVQLGLK